MKLEVAKRTTGKKGENNKIRREGNIPAILYNSKGEGHPITIKGDEFKAILRGIKQGLLATTVFELNVAGHIVKAIVKDIQYHVASYNIEHMDFLELKEDEEVTVNVPIQLVGAADCVGVKLGGFIRQAVRTLKVSCLPKHIPQELFVDVKELGVAQSKTLADIAIPPHVTPRVSLKEVAVVIGKKAGA
jgi:large subunit ribosomal protein L25